MSKRRLLNNPFFWGYAIVYAASLFIMVGAEGYPVEEALTVFVLFGLILPAIAYWLVWRATPLHETRVSCRDEMFSLTGLLVLATAYVTLGPGRASLLIGVTPESPRLYALITLTQKLIVFVVIPAFVLSKRFGLASTDFGWTWNVKGWLQHRHIRALIGLSAFMIVFQYFFGQAAAPVKHGQYSFGQLTVGLPLAFVWLLIEVGLVEEFFFRAVIQSRVTAYLKSDVSGIVVSALLFGLAHAPGLIFRDAGTLTQLGANPFPLLAIAYSVVVLSAAGLFLGIVWARTRNLLLVMIIHASGDLLPNFAEFAKTWHLS